MKFRIFAIAASMVVLAACSRENQTGQPDTDTTGNIQSIQQTADTASATTTGAGAGTLTVMSNEDKEFVVKAGMGGLAEVQMGNLALQKASNADVKAFAQRMVTDHSKANAELAQFATTKGLALPSELAGEHQSGYEHLNGLSGAEFDKAYMEHMVADHEKAVAEFDKASTSASDSDLKAWAGKTLPTLKEHLEQAKTTARKL
jgi:putative membrane protein